MDLASPAVSGTSVYANGLIIYHPYLVIEYLYLILLFDIIHSMHCGYNHISQHMYADYIKLQFICT